MTVAEVPRRPDLSQVQEMETRCMHLLRSDLAQAEGAISACATAAQRSRSTEARGIAARLRGHFQLLSGDHAGALRSYRRACALFDKEGLELQRAMTQAASIQALIYRERYQEAFDFAAAAEAVFRRLGEDFRLARLRANVANLLQRLDRLEEADRAYAEAEAVLESADAHQDVAITRRNRAVALMGLGRWDEAESAFARARAYFVERGLAELVLECDLNLGYLWGRRGQVREALDLYRSLHGRMAGEDDRVERGAAYLDACEFMAAVGLKGEAIEAADRAAAMFARLEMPLDEGRALLMGAWADGGRAEEEKLRRAREVLGRTRNPLWKALADLHLARVQDERQPSAATLRALRSAVAKIVRYGSHERVAGAKIALTEALLRRGDPEAAAALPEAHDPYTRFRVAWLRGRASTSEDRSVFFREAVESFEQARTELGIGGLRLAFQSGRLTVFEDAFLAEPDAAERFRLVQYAKSRSLLEPAPVGGAESQRLRAALAYVQREEEGGRPSARRQDLERRLLEVRRHEETIRPSVSPDSLAQIQASLGADRGLAEYFVAGGRVHVQVIGRDSAAWMDLADVREVEALGRRLRFLLARSDPASEGVLEQLGSLLIVPWLDGAEARNWVLAPHAALRAMPLHAALIEGTPFCLTQPVAYAPSASVWRRSTLRSSVGTSVAVLGASDALAPEIDVEARAVAAATGAQEIALGEEASLEWLRERAPRLRWLHVAAHGLHRAAQPEFSAIRLGASEVTAYDVARLSFHGSGVVLSGCGTGLSQTGAGGEPFGLIEAFLLAGSKCVLGALWDVHDIAARDFMMSLYSHAGAAPDEAYRAAVSATRSRYPDPSRWAPFAFFGHLGEKGVRIPAPTDL